MSLDNDAQIETIDRNHSLGRRVYVRSLPEDRSGAVAEKRELCLFLLARPAVLQRLLPRGRDADAVERLIEHGEEGKDISARPAGQIDFLTGSRHKEPSRF